MTAYVKRPLTWIALSILMTIFWIVGLICFLARANISSIPSPSRRVASSCNISSPVASTSLTPSASTITNLKNSNSLMSMLLCWLPMPDSILWISSSAIRICCPNCSAPETGQAGTEVSSVTGHASYEMFWTGSGPHWARGCSSHRV